MYGKLPSYTIKGVKENYNNVVLCHMGIKKKDVELAKTLADRLKEVRKDKGITQENVRFDLNMNIGRVEIGENCISLPTLKRLCDYYGITLEEFFRGIGTK